MSVVKYNFSGHESFPCKSLWLKKGYDFVVAGNQFSSAEAVMELGVGKNMVASIRYWLKAFGVIDSTGQTTTLGKYLLDDESGRDKYIEDLGTLWILHFNIINNLEATIYEWLFRGFPGCVSSDLQRCWPLKRCTGPSRYGCGSGMHS